jgi:hypothetical protein
MMGIVNIFGSEDSADVDVMVMIDDMPSIAVCKDLCAELDANIKKKLGTDKEVNTNLAVIKDGVIFSVYKGIPIECNNSLYETYQYHTQLHDLMIDRKVSETPIVAIKCARTLRALLTLLSRTDYRREVKSALKSTTEDKIETLRYIDLDSIEDFNKNNLNTTEIYKAFAFQIGQTMTFLEGDVVYTKSKISELYEGLRVYLERRSSDAITLNEYKIQLLDMIESYFESDLNELVVEF